MKGAKIVNQEKIGNFIAELRREKNITQEELAEKLSVNVKSVSRWENGRNLPDHAMLKDLCNIFGISINELYEGQKIAKTKKVRQIFWFYTLVSFTGIFIVPTLGIIGPTFIVCSVLCPILGLIKLISSIIGINIPMVMFQFGEWTLNPIISFPLLLVVSALLYVVGMYSWKLLIKYIHAVAEKKKKLYIDL